MPIFLYVTVSGCLLHRDFVDHAVKISGCTLDVKVLVLSGSAFGRKHSTSMDIVEVAVRELISSLVVFVLVFVDPQMPFRVLIETLFCSVRLPYSFPTLGVRHLPALTL